MRGLYIEHRKLRDTDSLSWDIAHHLATRQLRGIVAIVTDKPIPLCASVSKQWQKVIRQIQRARSSTLDASRIFELSQQLSHMQSLHMSTHSIERTLHPEVHFVTAQQVYMQLPTCHTMYLATPLDTPEVERLTSYLPPGALLVTY